MSKSASVYCYSIVFSIWKKPDNWRILLRLGYQMVAGQRQQCRNLWYTSIKKINGSAQSLLLKRDILYYEKWDLNCCVDDYIKKFGDSKYLKIKCISKTGPWLNATIQVLRSQICSWHYPFTKASFLLRFFSWIVWKRVDQFFASSVESFF